MIITAAIGRSGVLTGLVTDDVQDNKLTIQIDGVKGKSIAVSNCRQGKVQGNGMPSLKAFCTMPEGPNQEVYDSAEEEGPPLMMGKSHTFEGEIAGLIGEGVIIEYSAPNLTAGYLYMTYRIV